MIRTAVFAFWAMLLASAPTTVLVRPGADLGWPVGVTHPQSTGDHR